MATDISYLSSWLKSQKVLLQRERETEIAQLSERISSLSALECQDAGLSLLQLHIAGISSGLFGRVIVALSRQDRKPLPRSFKVGDEIALYCSKRKLTDGSGDEVLGIVSKTTQSSIEIACNDIDEVNFPPPLRMDLRASEHTFKQYLQALDDLEAGSGSLLGDLFFRKTESVADLIVPRQFILDRGCLFNPNLNDSQLRAVECSLASPRVSVIHGPPGTGKTSTVAELILQSVIRQEQRLLVCAPSNVAVDNILERLVQLNQKAAVIGKHGKQRRGVGGSMQATQLRLARLGHPARVSPITQPYCLDSLIAKDEGSEIVSDVRKEIEKIQKDLSKHGRGPRMDRGQRRELQAEVRLLRKEVRKREDAVVKDIMRSRQVILCTCTTASSRLLRDIEFDMVIIDEAAQAMEVACWIPLSKTNKCVLVGDHNQLPPTVKSSEALAGGLGTTLFERIIRDTRFASVVHLLDTQYRMNRRICQWASEAMYGGALLSHPSVAEHTIEDMSADPRITSPSTGGADVVETATGSTESGDGVDPEVADECLAGGQARVPASSDLTDKVQAEPVLLLIDTAGAGMHEESANEGSYRNSGEAHIVMLHVLELMDERRVAPRHIGVITPYNGQLEALRQSFTADGADPRLLSVEVRTVDGFQGGERECIILSLVRSNIRKEVGFLGDRRRINVAVTRARRHLAVVCDTDTCAADPFIRSLIDHMAATGEHRSAFEGYITDLWQPQDTDLPAIAKEATVQSMAGRQRLSIELKKKREGQIKDNEKDLKKIGKDGGKEGPRGGTGSGTRSSSKEDKMMMAREECEDDKQLAVDTTAISSSDSLQSFVAAARLILVAFMERGLNHAESVTVSSAPPCVDKLVVSCDVIKRENTDVVVHNAVSSSISKASGGNQKNSTVGRIDGSGDGGDGDDGNNRELLAALASFHFASLPSMSPKVHTTTGKREVTAKEQDQIDKPDENEDVLRFSPLLSSLQRRAVHEAAESLRLLHRSAGEGSSRYIEVARTKDSQDWRQRCHHLPESSLTCTNYQKLEQQQPQTVSSQSHNLQNIKACKAPGPQDFSKRVSSSSSPSSSSSVPHSSSSKLSAPVDTPSSNLPRPSLAAPSTVGGIYVSAERAAAVALKNKEVCSNTSLLQSCKAIPSQSDKTVSYKLGKKSGAASTVPGDDEEEEMALLQAAIEANQQHARYHQYRIPSTPMPQPEKERTKQQLHRRLCDAQAARRGPAAEKSAESNLKEKKEKEASLSRKKATAKKPVPNFGGGRLGSS